MPYLDEAARQLGISEKTLRRWLRLVEPPIAPTPHKYDRRYWLITDQDVEVIRAARSELPGAKALPANGVISSSSQLAFRRSESVEGRYSDTSPVKIATPRQRPLRTHAPKAGGETKDLPPLPVGHSGRYRLATDHEIPPADVDYWCHRGDIEQLRGVYVNARGNRVTDPVTPKGLAQFYQLASPRSDFTRCNHCPHTAEEADSGE